MRKTMQQSKCCCCCCCSPCRWCILPAAAPRPCTHPLPAHQGPPGCQHCSNR
jgi:hypothetical protein